MKASKRHPSVYLEDIRAAAERIREYAGKGREGFFRDYLLQDGIIRQLSILGEAASKLPKAVRDRRPDIPWKDIVGMRNIIIHDYSEIDLEWIWRTVEEDLPTLLTAVKEMLDRRAA